MAVYVVKVDVRIEPFHLAHHNILEQKVRRILFRVENGHKAALLRKNLVHQLEILLNVDMINDEHAVMFPERQGKRV